jgi:ferredoxin
MKVEVDRYACVGHGRCAALAPQLYELDDLGSAALAGQGETPIEPGFENAARDGAQACPEAAIRLIP